MKSVTFSGVQECARVFFFQLVHQEEDVRRCQRERDEAVVREKVLEKKFHELEAEAEARANVKEDKARHIKLMEVQNIYIQQ